ncbi:hypothetical protein ACFYOT_34515 [Saccharothrix saharensis]|uniref:hypothetical protein n=1 Tax=Saccharothrix saharensis TaxID=571190 RepID=UPI0036A57F14
MVDEESGRFAGKEKVVRLRIIDTINRENPRRNTPDSAGDPRPGRVYEWDFGVTVRKGGQRMAAET